MDDRLLHILIESFPKIIIPGLLITIPLTIISFLLGLCIAIITALIIFKKVIVLKEIAIFYIWLIRGTPLLVQLFIVYYGLPSVGIRMGAFTSAVVVFSINEGAYAAETLRGAIESIPIGQMEAGYCVGMKWNQIIRRIVLPQALRTAFPALGNELISMVKDTSLAANITVAEMFMRTQRIVSIYYEPLLLYIEVGLIYLLFSSVLSILERVGEKRLSSYGKR